MPEGFDRWLVVYAQPQGLYLHVNPGVTPKNRPGLVANHGVLRWSLGMICLGVLGEEYSSLMIDLPVPS